MRNDINIYVLCYKDVDYEIPNNNLYIPIQCGKDLNIHSICDVCDNEGDNISWLNPIYVEATGTYWIWKHHNPDLKYIGQCQYRRQLVFRENKNFDKVFKDYDAILPKPYTFPINVYSYYKLCHHLEDLDIVKDIIVQFYPEYKDAILSALNGKDLYYSSGMVLKAEDFHRYCEFLFGVLNEYLRRTHIYTVEDMRKRISAHPEWYDRDNVHKEVEYQMRVGGYLAERIFTIFAAKNFKNPYILDYTKKEVC